MQENARIIESFGFRSMLAAQYQSWGGFTGRLFGNDEKRREFDKIHFNFDLEENSEPRWSVETDDECLTSAYFGRPLKNSTFRLSREDETLHAKLARIKQILPIFFRDMMVDEKSDPMLVIDLLDSNEIYGYYTWEYYDEYNEMILSRNIKGEPEEPQ